mgnify:CR=1 FL=1
MILRSNPKQYKLDAALPGQAQVTPLRQVVEAAVTEATCGRELLGETLTSRGGAVEVAELTLAMPDCAAAGDILVLKNLVPEMTLAAK